MLIIPLVAFLLQAQFVNEAVTTITPLTTALVKVYFDLAFSNKAVSINKSLPTALSILEQIASSVVDCTYGPIDTPTSWLEFDFLLSYYGIYDYEVPSDYYDENTFGDKSIPSSGPGSTSTLDTSSLLGLNPTDWTLDCPKALTLYAQPQTPSDLHAFTQWIKQKVLRLFTEAWLRGIIDDFQLNSKVFATNLVNILRNPSAWMDQEVGEPVNTIVRFIFERSGLYLWDLFKFTTIDVPAYFQSEDWSMHYDLAMYHFAEDLLKPFARKLIYGLEHIFHLFWYGPIDWYHANYIEGKSPNELRQILAFHFVVVMAVLGLMAPQELERTRNRPSWKDFFFLYAIAFWDVVREWACSIHDFLLCDIIFNLLTFVARKIGSIISVVWNGIGGSNVTTAASINHRYSSASTRVLRLLYSMLTPIRNVWNIIKIPVLTFVLFLVSCYLGYTYRYVVHQASYRALPLSKQAFTSFCKMWRDEIPIATSHIKEAGAFYLEAFKQVAWVLIYIPNMVLGDIWHFTKIYVLTTLKVYEVFLRSPITLGWSFLIEHIAKPLLNAPVIMVKAYYRFVLSFRNMCSKAIWNGFLIFKPCVDSCAAILMYTHGFMSQYWQKLRVETRLTNDTVNYLFKRHINLLTSLFAFFHRTVSLFKPDYFRDTAEGEFKHTIKVCIAYLGGDTSRNGTSYLQGLYTGRNPYRVFGEGAAILVPLSLAASLLWMLGPLLIELACNIWAKVSPYVQLMVQRPLSALETYLDDIKSKMGRNRFVKCVFPFFKDVSSMLCNVVPLALAAAAAGTILLLLIALKKVIASGFRLWLYVNLELVCRILLWEVLCQFILARCLWTLAKCLSFLLHSVVMYIDATVVARLRDNMRQALNDRARERKDRQKKYQPVGSFGSPLPPSPICLTIPQIQKQIQQWDEQAGGLIKEISHYQYRWFLLKYRYRIWHAATQEWLEANQFEGRQSKPKDLPYPSYRTLRTWFAQVQTLKVHPFLTSPKARSHNNPRTWMQWEQKRVELWNWTICMKKFCKDLRASVGDLEKRRMKDRKPVFGYNIEDFHPQLKPKPKPKKIIWEPTPTTGMIVFDGTVSFFSTKKPEKPRKFYA